MRVTTQVLSSLALGLQATPEPGDSEVQVPSAVLPVINQLPFACLPKSQPASGSPNYDQWNDSGMTSFYESLAAAAGLSATRVFNLGPGLWSIAIDWNAMLPNTATSQMSLAGAYGDPNVGLFNVSIFAYDGYLGNNMINGRWEHQILIPKNMIFRGDLNHDNTAGTSVSIVALNIRANRLL